MLLYVLVTSSIKLDRLTYYILIYMLGSVVYTLLLGVNKSIFSVISQTLISNKFYIVTLVLLTLVNIEDMTKRMIYILFVFTMVGFMLSILLPDLMQASSKERFISGFSRVGGLQYSPNLLGYTLSFMLAAYLLVEYKGSFLVASLIALLAIALIILTGSRTSLFLSVVGYLLFVWKSFALINKRISFFWLAVIMSMPITLLAGAFGILDGILINIYSVENGSGYIRGMMIAGAFSLSMAYFPFGSGAASFGTALSQGSVAYSMAGISGTRFYNDFVGVFDSNFASILGEFGFAGLVLNVVFIYLLIKKCYSGKISAGHGVFWFIQFSLLVMTSPILMSSYMAVMVPLFLVYIGKNESR